MKVLQGLGASILSFLLFLSLCLFGIAFMLQSTVLDPDFMVAQVDRIDVSAMARDIAEEQIGDQLPPDLLFLKEGIYDVIDENESWLKEQLNTTIYAAYDFFLGRTDRLEIAIPLDGLKEDLRASLWETFKGELPRLLPDLVTREVTLYLERYIDDFADQIPEEYLPPGIAGLPAEQLKPYLEQYLQDVTRQIVDENFTPEISGLLEVLLKPYFDESYDEFASQIPSVLTVDESQVPPEVMEQLLLARTYVGWFQTGYYLLIGFMVLLVAGIVLIYHNVREATRALGITLLICGVIVFIFTFFIRNYMPDIASFYLQGIQNIPVPLQTWLNGLYADLLSPLQTFSLGALVAGIALLVVSFVYKSRAVAE